MKLLLAQNATYIPTHGGANKANRLLLEGLAARGHQCAVVAPAATQQGPATATQFLQELDARRVTARTVLPHVIQFEHQGVEVHAVTDPSQLRACLIERQRALTLDWVLVAAEDPGQVLLKTALETMVGRAVYVAQTTLLLPFGPMSFQPSAAKTALVRQATGVITISKHLQTYIRCWAGVEATVIPFPVYGEGPFPDLSKPAAGEAKQPFDLSSGPLLRARVLQLDDQEYVLLLTMHHVVSDGWSTGVFVRELSELYNAFASNRPSPLPELPLQYADFAVWQRQWFQGERLEELLGYWREQMKGAPPVLELPTDRPRQAVHTVRGAREFLELSRPVSDGLKALSQQEGTTLFMTLLAVFGTLLARTAAPTMLSLAHRSPTGRTRRWSESSASL